MIASCAYQGLRARTATARQALNATRAARERLRGCAILAQPRDLSLHVVPQIPRATCDTRPGVALEQGAGLRLEILIEFWRTLGSHRVQNTCSIECTEKGARRRADGALIKSRSYVK